MDLRAWLRSLGLEQYEATFRENAIDDTVVRSLTVEDLKDLGVGIVGHRRKLLDAIAALRTDASPKVPLSTALPTIDKTPVDTAERRQVTVMLSDLVGSTALCAHGPGGPARGHFGLSQMRCRDRAPLRWISWRISRLSALHGRRSVLYDYSKR